MSVIRSGISVLAAPLLICFSRRNNFFVISPLISLFLYLSVLTVMENNGEKLRKIKTENWRIFQLTLFTRLQGQCLLFCCSQC
jgi:hypothetical protein